VDELERIRNRKKLEILRQLQEREHGVLDIASLEEVLQKSREKLVLVDLWAPWCMPCRILGPILERLSREMGFVLAKLNTEQHPQEAARLGVQGIPMVLLVRNGKVVDSFVGVRAIPFIKDIVGRYS